MHDEVVAKRCVARRVLLVDDDSDIRRDYSRVLRNLGCVVETAADVAAKQTKHSFRR